jgi:iron complex outermembrane receptor protein
MTLLKKDYLTAVIAAACAGALLSPVAFAQADYALEEIIVTATKRSQNLQDVALAVTALSGESLAASRISRSEDLVNLSPSLTFQSGGSDNGSSYNIRGIGTQSFSSGVEPSIAAVVDGVILGRSGMAFTELLDVKRVEILRGPQGMLFGKNASGGVVHIVSNDPSDIFEASIGGKHMVSGTDEYSVNAMVSVPLTDNLGIRAAGYTTDRDGHIENIASGRDVNGRKSEGGRVKLNWQASDNLSLKWTSDYSEKSGECCQPQPRSATPTEAYFLGDVVASEDNKSINVSADLYNSTRSWGHSAELNWDLGGYSLTSISAYRDYQSSANQDVDGTATTLLDINAGQSNQTQTTQEIRLASPQDQKLTYVVGAYYFDQSMKRDFERVYHDIFGNYVPTFPGLKFGSQYQAAVDSTSYSGFGQLEYNLTEDMRLIGGARYTNETLDFEFQRSTSIGAAQPIVPNQAQYSDSTSDDDWSLKVGAQWDINDDVMSYITLTEGYKGPAFNVIFEMTPGTTQPVAAETSKAFELGIKSALLDRRLMVNAALFQSTYENFQAQAQDASSSVFTLLNAGEVRTRGLELDFVAQPIEALYITGGIALVDAEIVDFAGGPCSPRQAAADENSCASGSQDLSGKSLPFSPDTKLNLAIEYQMAFGANHQVTPRIAYRWQDDIFFAMDHDEAKAQKAYGVFDLGITLRSNDDRYSATLFVDNVTDEAYVDAIIHNSIWAGAYDHYYSPSSERTTGIDFKYNW